MAKSKDKTKLLKKLKSDFTQFCSLFKKAIKQANSRVIEKRSFSYGVYFEEIAFMLITYFNKKIHKYIFFSLLLIMYLSAIIVSNQTTMTLNMISLYIFYFLVVPFIYTYNLVYFEKINANTYVKLQLIYLFIPILATVQYFVFNNIYIIITSLITACYCPLFIYGCFKKTQIQKKHISYLKFYNFVFSTIFTICFYIIDIYTNIIGSKLFLFIISPLLILHIAYEKLLLDME